MYYRQPSTADDSAKSIDQPEPKSVASFEQTEQTSDLAALDEELNLSSFTSSDLMQLNDCLGLDWLINNETSAESKLNVASCHNDIDKSYFTMDDLDTTVVESTYFTDDSLIPADSTNCLFPNDSSYSYSNPASDDSLTIDNLLEDLGLIASSRYEQVVTDIGGLVGQTNACVQVVDAVDSLRTNNCSSPSSSSGYESDFKSTYGDDHFSFCDDIGFTNISEEPFTELFPALY
jgi:hypothetical protein